MSSNGAVNWIPASSLLDRFSIYLKNIRYEDEIEAAFTGGLRFLRGGAGTETASNRRQRRAKTDRLDIHKLLMMLLRHMAGEQKVWSVVRVPSVEEEDRRQLHRELTTAKCDRTRVSNRIKGLLAGYGVQLALQGDVDAQLDQAHQWDGSPLPPALLSRRG